LLTYVEILGSSAVSLKKRLTYTGENRRKWPTLWSKTHFNKRWR